MGVLRGFMAAVACTALLGCIAAAPFPAAEHPAVTDPSIDHILDLLPADALLFGEQHDAPEHHWLERQTVEALAGRDTLAAVVLEMAEHGRSTQGLAPGASEAEARAALGWSEDQWPWQDYGPAVMAALRAGVPVLGANLSREQVRAALADPALDGTVPASVLAAQREAIRDGHCHLLPEAQITPMTRVQLARDRSIARTIERALVPGKSVLLIAGAGHARRDLGVPLHLAPQVLAKVVLALVQRSGSAVEREFASAAGSTTVADRLLPTAALPAKDHCAALRRT